MPSTPNSTAVSLKRQVAQGRCYITRPVDTCTLPTQDQSRVLPNVFKVGNVVKQLIWTRMLLTTPLSSCTLRPEWTWFVIKGVRSISANVVVLIDRIIVLNDRKISPRPLCNAKCQIRTRLPFILEMFTKLSSSVLTLPFYRTAPKTPSRQCNASEACGTVRALRTIPSGC